LIVGAMGSQGVLSFTINWRVVLNLTVGQGKTFILSQTDFI